MFKEFKQFIMQGPVLSLAIGVIIGAAFGKIVDAAVGDLIMPLVAAVFGSVDFSNLFIVLSDIPAGTPHTYEALSTAGVNMLAYGHFLTILVNFIFLALGVFIIIKIASKLYQNKAEEPSAPAEEVLLLREIRDQLKNK